MIKNQDSLYYFIGIMEENKKIFKMSENNNRLGVDFYKNLLSHIFKSYDTFKFKYLEF